MKKKKKEKQLYGGTLYPHELGFRCICSQATV